ncbi:hypothetical protein J2S43_000115 [Catenuloplanes nepalensis]|uniref:Mersacidin/lichenicidin family type 2 lantibiotic n=1 Tax=Catenuloplanes nepalensis TaxID=587533 RepID=A0ABT9MJK6_9ACTN|nr:hypothetical protein [Catenuloplanes nepalensis]
MDTSAPQTARIWNHLPGGTDAVEADRAAGRKP